MTLTKYDTDPIWKLHQEDYVPITTPYSELEHKFLDRAISNLKGIDYRLGEDREGITIYRKRKEVNTLKDIL